MRQGKWTSQHNRYHPTAALETAASHFILSESCRVMVFFLDSHVSMIPLADLNMKDTHFNDWDVAMSPVIGNIGSTGASVAVTKGYSVANSAYVCDPETSF